MSVPPVSEPPVVGSLVGERLVVGSPVVGSLVGERLVVGSPVVGSLVGERPAVIRAGHARQHPPLPNTPFLQHRPGAR
jgi:hypothetical protein